MLPCAIILKQCFRCFLECFFFGKLSKAFVGVCFGSSLFLVLVIKKYWLGFFLTLQLAHD